MLDVNILRKDLPSVVARLEARKSPQPYLDTAAFALARDNGLPILVYALDDKEGLMGVLTGKTRNTRVG